MAHPDLSSAQPCVSSAIPGAPRVSWQPHSQSSQLWGFTTLGSWSDNSQILPQVPRDKNTFCWYLFILQSHCSTSYLMYLWVHLASTMCSVPLSFSIGGSICQIPSRYAFCYFCRCICSHISGYPNYRVLYSLVISSSAALADCWRHTNWLISSCDYLPVSIPHGTSAQHFGYCNCLRYGLFLIPV